MAVSKLTFLKIGTLQDLFLQHFPDDNPPTMAFSRKSGFQSCFPQKWDPSRCLSSIFCIWQSPKIALCRHGTLQDVFLQYFLYGNPQKWLSAETALSSKMAPLIHRISSIFSRWQPPKMALFRHEAFQKCYPPKFISSIFSRWQPPKMTLFRNGTFQNEFPQQWHPPKFICSAFSRW